VEHISSAKSHTYKDLCFELTSKVLPHNPDIQCRALNLSAKIIEQAIFVITTGALKFSSYCMLISKTFPVNALGMLAIASQTAQT